MRTAVAGLSSGACFGIGSYAARLDTDSSPVLGELLGALGSGVSLSAADYNGLASTDVQPRRPARRQPGRGHAGGAGPG